VTYWRGHDKRCSFQRRLDRNVLVANGGARLETGGEYINNTLICSPSKGKCAASSTEIKEDRIYSKRIDNLNNWMACVYPYPRSNQSKTCYTLTAVLHSILLERVHRYPESY
jgi:hypothetical protein